MECSKGWGERGETLGYSYTTHATEGESSSAITKIFPFSSSIQAKSGQIRIRGWACCSIFYHISSHFASQTLFT